VELTVNLIRGMFVIEKDHQSQERTTISILLISKLMVVKYCDMVAPSIKVLDSEGCWGPENLHVKLVH
jgi:hypothetical protein